MPAPDGPTIAVLVPRPHRETDVPEHRVRAVAEADPAEAERVASPGRSAAGSTRPWTSTSTVLLRQRGDLLDPDHRAQRVLRRGVGLEHPTQRHDHHEQVEDERDELGDLHRAVGDQVAADAQHRDERPLHRDPDDRRDQRHHLRQPDAGAIGVARQRFQLDRLALGGAGRTNGADPGDRPAPPRQRAPRPGSARSGSASGCGRRAR